MRPGEGRRGRAVVISVAVVVAVCMVIGVVVLQYSIDSSPATRAGWRSTTPFDGARSFLDILGGVREAVAAYFWTKTDEIYHEYFKSDITKEEALFPYYWMATRLDPHFAIAYYFASWFLCRFGQPEKGYELALEGLRNNPTSPELQQNLAQIYLFFKKDPRKAIYHIEKALEMNPDPGDRAVYRNFKQLAEDVLAGKKSLPPLSSLEALKNIGQEAEEHGGHHEHEH